MRHNLPVQPPLAAEAADLRPAQAPTSWAAAPSTSAADDWGTDADAGGWGVADAAGGWGGAGDSGEADWGSAPSEPAPALSGKGMFGGIMEASMPSGTAEQLSVAGGGARSAAPQFTCRKVVAYDDPLCVGGGGRKGSDKDAKIQAMYAKYLASELAEDSTGLPPQLGTGPAPDEDSDEERDLAQVPVLGEGMFDKAIKASPQQVMRYAFEGAPVLPKGYKVSSPPKCPHCGGPRVFEVQLMPALLQALDVDAAATVSSAVPADLVGDVVVGEATAGGGAAAESAAGDSDSEPDEPKASATSRPGQFSVVGGGMDWGSVLVFSCEASCGEQGEEWVAVIPASAI